jgi:diguanylate cyclase (GGDEF)-like protein/PAS domain S-box-containing protein
MPSIDHSPTVFRCAPTGLAIISLDGSWVDVNDALCRSLGYPQAELVGDSVETFVHPSDYAIAELEVRLLAGEIEVGQVERRFIRRDGTVVWMEVACSVARDELGDPQYFIAQCKDITQAKAVEQELARERLWLAESQAAGRIGSWELDLETGVMRWSREQFNIYGVNPAAGVPGLDELLQLIHAEDRGGMLESLRGHLASGEDFVDEYRIRHSRLGIRTLLVRGRYLSRDPDLGRPARMAGTTLDVTAERTVDAARRRDEERLRLLATLVQQSDDAIIVCGTDGVITQWNEGARRLYGYEASEAIGRRVGFLAPHDRAGEGEQLIRAALAGEAIRGLQSTRRCRDGRLVQVALTVSPIVGGDGQPLGVSAVARDITDQVRAQERLRNNERQLYEAQALAKVGSWEWELVRARPSWSAEMGRLYGYEAGHTPLVSDLVARVHEDDRDDVWRSIEDARAGRANEAEYRVVLPDGAIRHVHGRHQYRTDEAGTITHIYGAVQDVTERKGYEAELQRLATHDALTGLPNRRTFEERLQIELARARREGANLTLALLDIDCFKRINDTLGHQVGDLVLQRTGREFAGQVRSHELIARVGGEEFAWLLPGADPVGARVAVERVRRAVSALDFGEVGRVTVSAGMCTLEPDMDAESFFRCADMALLAAKAQGRDRALASTDLAPDCSYAALATGREAAA